MPVYQEEKYLVKSFDAVKGALDDSGSPSSPEAITTHYYAQKLGDGVVKLVHFEDKDEIHVLEQQDGKFSLAEKVPVKDVETGLAWLKGQGFDTAGIVKMANTNYTYRGGVVGLYLINDFLKSVILDFPDSQHEAVKEALNLTDAEVISLPYDKYLETIGRLETIHL